ncbi:MAG: qseC [Gammaproteobacteria bacterium]|jgi:two-component system sensor histidine kinase QseC|nr:qseC [Gammaproteobacteria bacterium]
MKRWINFKKTLSNYYFKKYGNRVSSLRRFLLVSILSSLFLAIIILVFINYLQLSFQNQRVLQSELVNAARVFNAFSGINLNRPAHKIASDLLDQSNQSNSNEVPGMNIYDNDLNYRNKMVFQIWNLSSNQLMTKSINAPIERLSNTNMGFANIALSDGSTWYSFSLSNQNKNIRVIVAVPQKLESAVNFSLFIHACIFFGLVFIAVGLLLVLLIQIALGPIERVTNEISERGPYHLSPIDTQGIPIEISPLVIALNRLFQQLSEAIAREKQFTTDAAHELRTPLAAVKTQVEVVLREKDEQQRDKILSKILIGTNRIAHIVDQLLTLSRLESTLKLAHPSYLDLNKLTTKMVAELAPLAIEKQLEIELFSPDSEIFINGDDNLLSVLLRNLIDNAIRYTPAHSKVLVLLSETERSICLQIIDNGPGIPEELHHRLFGRFFRQVGNQAEGSGLGLSITKEIARLHHASIQAKKPEYSCGLEMRIDFPKQPKL